MYHFMWKKKTGIHQSDDDCLTWWGAHTWCCAQIN